MTFLVLGVLAVLAAGAAFAIALAVSSKRKYEKQREILPGTDANVPDEWAGAHSPEAKLHRRLGEAVRALRARADSLSETVMMLERRVELEQQALEVDRRLVEASKLPRGKREGPIARLEADVAAIEQAAVDLTTLGHGVTGIDLPELDEEAREMPQPPFPSEGTA